MPTHAPPKESASHASKAFFGPQPARPSSFFSPSAAPIARQERQEAGEESGPGRESVVQTKLTVGVAGDPLEREADMVADRVVRRSVSDEVRKEGSPPVQTKRKACPEEQALRRLVDADAGEEVLQAEGDSSGLAVPDSVRQSLVGSRGGGGPLNPALREDMESAFSADFTHVRIHTDSSAEGLSRDLQARAFTHGADIYFNRGEFRPDTRDGMHLLAHELAHTIQQSRAGASRSMRGKDPATTKDHGPSDIQREPGPRALTPPFNPRECALLLRVANPDMAGPPDAPPGKFKEVWAEFCIPKPRLDDPERGFVLKGDDAFGPFQKGSYIRVQRFAEIELETGITVQFSIRGFQRTKDDFTKLPANEKEVEALLEAEGTSMFELDIETALDASNTRTYSLIGSWEYFKKLQQTAPGLHPLMRNVGASEWAKVMIDNPTQYRSILSRLLTADPYLNRFTVSLKKPPPSKAFDTLSEAEAAAGSSASEFVAGKVITRGADKKYRAYYLQPMDLFWTSERARHSDGKGMAPRYAFLDEGFQSLHIGGRKIEKLSAFADSYYLDADAAQRGVGGAQDALVYKTPDGFYGRYGLRRSDAFAWWKKMDGLSPDKIGDETVRHWKGYDVGKLHSLYVRGQGSFHSVDAGYLQGRDRYKKDRKTLEADRVQIGKKDYDPTSWFVLAETGHEDNFRYLEGELDRPTEAGGGTLLGQIEGSDKLTTGMAQYAWDRVRDRARLEAQAIVKKMQSLVKQLGTTEADLKRILLAYPKLDTETRKAVVQMMGVEEKDQEGTIKTLSSTANALDIYRGLEVGGVSIARLTRSIAKTRADLDELFKGLESGKIMALGFEADFGTLVREKAYRSLGFSRLKGADYPHHDSRGLMPGYLEGDPKDSANLMERLYGNYVAAQDTAGTIVKVLVVASVVALTAALIFLSGGLAALIAEAWFGGSVVAEIVIGAAIFTGLSEGLAQAMGQGALNTKDRDFGLHKLGGSFLLNVATFGIFRGLNTVMKGWSLAARLGTTYVSFVGVSVAAHMLSHGGKLPKGAEWGWLLYETTLMFVLLEAGGYFGRNAFMKMQIAGRNVRAGNLAQTLEGIKTDAEILRGDYNKAFENASRAEKLALADRYTKVLERQEKLLVELGSLKDIEVNVDVAAELRQVKQHKQAVAEATFLLKSGLRQLGSSPEVYTYSEGTEGANAIKGKFGDKVKGPDSDGVITVTDGGRTLLFLPERSGAAAKPKAKALSSRLGVRALAEGVFGIEPRMIEGIKTDITGSGGTVNELRPGHYSATQGGESFVIVSEKEVRIASLAKEAHGKQNGAGQVLIVQSMRSALAREGLEARLKGEWKDLSEGRLIEKVTALEDAAIAGGRSLNDVLEGEALAARATKTGEAFDVSGQTRGGRVSTADAHIQALRDQIAFVKSLEGAGIKTSVARSTLEARLASVAATRGDLVLNEGGLKGSRTLHTYQPGPEAKSLLGARYGAGKVGAPDANGLIRVDIGGVQHVFVPVPEGATAGAATATVSEGGQGRVIIPGVVAVEPRALRGAKPRVEGKGGTWTDAGDGVAIVTLNGETVVVISEGALALVPTAQAAETATPGSGLATLRAQLRSELARSGLDEWVKTNRAGRSDGDALAELEVIEKTEAGKKRDPRSLHAFLEAQAVSAMQARARGELITLIKSNAFVKDPWVRKMITDRNSGEIQGVLAEMRVSQMKAAEIAANPSYAGRNVRVIDKVWIMAKQPEASVAAWEAAHPKPERSAFTDQKSFDGARDAWNFKKAALKDLPGGGLGEQVKDVDHVIVEDSGGKLKLLETVETKYKPVSGEQTQATEARDALVDAIRLGTARGATAVVGRAEGNRVVEILTNKLEVTGTPPATAEHPDFDVSALAKDIIANPTLFEP